MAHTILIAAHAICGLAAFAFGIVVLRPASEKVTLPFQLYLGALSLMVLFLVSVVALDWSTIDTTSRLIFGALVLLALYVGWRGWHAFLLLQQDDIKQTDKYIDDVGFTLIALFDGFVIVFTLDLGSPIWLVLVIGALGVIVGRSAVMAVKRRTAMG